MDPLIGSALVGAGANLIGGIIGGIGQSKTNSSNLKIAREQMQWNEDMWNKQNAYNTPEAQIQRMRAAGLNPALMYTQGNVGNAGEVRGYSTPSMQNPLQPVGVGISDAGQAMMRLEMLKQQRAQTRMLEAKAIQTENQTMTAADYLKMFNAKYGNIIESSNLQNAKAQYQDIVNLHAPTLLYSQERRNEAELQKVVNETNAIVVRVNLERLRTMQGIRLSKAQEQQVIAATNYLNLKYKALEKMYPEQYNKLVAEIAKLGSENKLVDVNADAVERGINLKEEQFEFEKYLKSIEEGRKVLDTLTPW